MVEEVKEDSCRIEVVFMREAITITPAYILSSYILTLMLHQDQVNLEKFSMNLKII